VNRERIGIAMSGGVDSTATALILRENAAIEGFFMRLAQPDYERQLERVTRLADRLQIPLHIVDLREDFARKVLDYFAAAYFGGTTPNPCMICNLEIKFGLFPQAILAHGMDRMATGHYARVVRDQAGYHLLDGLDPAKNQAYFLARLTQRQLARIVFPLGEKRKSEIYSFVRRHGFTDFDGSESQDICFLANESVGQYLEQRYPEAVRSGPVLSADGRELGRHNGLFRYTIGQRRGLGIPDASPWYVTGIDVARNALIVGKNEELMRTSIELRDIHWISETMPDPGEIHTVRIRYSHQGANARIEQTDQHLTRILFEEPQRAITPGQFAVIYRRDEVLGSGIII